MSANDSLKRKIEELESADEQGEMDEPEKKHVKVDSDAQLNLENSAERKDNKSDQNECETSGEEQKSIPCISIRFHSDTVADLYKFKFLKFVNSFPEFQAEDDTNNIDIYRDERVGNEIEIKPVSCNSPTSMKKKKKHSKAKKELFVVDVTPSSNTFQTDLRYTTKFTINTEKVEENIKNSKSSCFNCDELHSLKDCPHPKDYARINASRQKFKSQSKTLRYHLEEDQKFGHLEPGKISLELRNGLGLQRNEAPHYIYLMRKLGYPPGWLEEAKFVHSNLDMFDIDGNHVKISSVKKHGLDESKIVEYPGFNVPFQKGVKDDYRMYRVPPYSENFSKQAMIDFFDKKFATEEDSLVETCTVDIHDQDCSKTSLEKNPGIKCVTDRNSPSLIDLEQQKLQLLEELNDEPKVLESDGDKALPVVKMSCFGTPILKSSSPYSRLPNPDNFSKDVSPVINFENLPNSTGKYEQLTDVLQKVRSTLKKNQNCNT